MKATRCAQCKVKFTDEQKAANLRIHYDCIPAWLNAHADKKEQARLKKEKSEDKARREKLKTNGQRKADAQKALNRWVVHGRDSHQPCISCGRFHEGGWTAGHYRSRGSAPHLALDPRNVHKQCTPCNLFLHGNLIEYRAGLVRRYGLEYVEAVESEQGTKHYTGTDYDAIKAKARADLRQLKEKA